MQEIDNCPICDTTCELEYGLEEGAGAKIDKEISYATCKTCKIRWRRRDDPKVLGKMIYEKWACRIPEFTLTLPLIVSKKFQPKWCRWIKVKEKSIPVGTEKGMKPEEALTRKGKTFEETIAIPRKESAFYDFELIRGDKVEGKIVSDEPVDIMFMDEKNFDKFDRDKSFEIEDTTESVYETKLDFKATKKGLWYVVIENPQTEPAKVKVHLYSLHKARTHEY